MWLEGLKDVAPAADSFHKERTPAVDCKPSGVEPIRMKAGRAERNQVFGDITGVAGLSLAQSLLLGYQFNSLIV